MAVKIADTFKPNNSVNPTGKGTFPVAKADDTWFNDGDSLQEKYDNGDLGGGGSDIQVDNFPTAGEDYLGKIYQFIGETSSYTNGYFYQCQIVDDGSGGIAYDWVNINVQEINSPIKNYTPTYPSYPAPIAPNDDYIYYTKWGTQTVWLYKTSLNSSLGYLSRAPFAGLISVIREDEQTVGYSVTCKCDTRYKRPDNDEYVSFNVFELRQTTLKLTNYNGDNLYTIDINSNMQMEYIEYAANYFYALPTGRTQSEAPIRLATFDDIQTIQYLDTPSGEKYGMVIQYIGADRSMFKHGHFYEWVDPGTGVLGQWEEVDVGSGSETIVDVETLPTGSDIKNVIYRTKDNGASKYYAGDATEEITETFGSAENRFYGTRADWDLLTTEEKIAYDYADFSNDANVYSATDGLDFVYMNVTLDALTAGWTAPHSGVMMVNIPGNATSAIGMFKVNDIRVALNGTAEQLYRSSTFAVPKGGVVTYEHMSGSNNFFATFAYFTGNVVVNEPKLISIPDAITRNTTTVSHMSEVHGLKQGRMAQIRCYLILGTDIPTADWVTIATVDNSLKPMIETQFDVSAGANVNNVAYARLTPNGEIQIWGNNLDENGMRISAFYFTAT